MKPFLVMCGCVTLLCGVIPSAAQSLGEVARQERDRRASSQNSARRVYTDEELSKSPAATTESSSANLAKDSPSTKADIAVQARTPGKELQTRIRDQKQKVQQLESQIQNLQRRIDQRDSIGGDVTVSQRVSIQGPGVGPGACALSKAMNSDPYKEWCDEPVKWAAELEKRRYELKEARAVLATLQEQARKMGYGSAFYDPE